MMSPIHLTVSLTRAVRAWPFVVIVVGCAVSIGPSRATAQTYVPAAAPLIEANGFEMVRLEALSAWSGATARFDPNTKQIEIWLDKVHVELLANAITARSGSSRLRLPTPAIVRDGAAYLPLQWAAEALGVEISVNRRGREVTVFNPRTRTSRDTPINGPQYRYSPEVTQWVPYVPRPRASPARGNGGPGTRASRRAGSRGETPYNNVVQLTNRRDATLHVTFENRDYTRQVRVAGGGTVTIGMPDGRFDVSCSWDDEPNAVYDSEAMTLNGQARSLTFGVTQGNRSLRRRR
jgi:hypothetical protein